MPKIFCFCSCKYHDILNNITDKFFFLTGPKRICRPFSRTINVPPRSPGGTRTKSNLDGMYFQPAARGAGKDKDRTTQPYGPELANGRLSLKSSYMTTPPPHQGFQPGGTTGRVSPAAQDTLSLLPRLLKKSFCSAWGQSERTL